MSQAAGRLVDFQAEGGVPGEVSEVVAWHNGRLLNTTLNMLKPGESQE